MKIRVDDLAVSRDDYGRVVVTADGKVDVLTMQPDVALKIADLLTIAAENRALDERRAA